LNLATVCGSLKSFKIIIMFTGRDLNVELCVYRAVCIDCELSSLLPLARDLVNEYAHLLRFDEMRSDKIRLLGDFRPDDVR